MTIDNAILRIEHSSMNVDDKETADFIIDTMHKYQKVQRVLEEIRADIISYEGDCRLSVDEYPSCKQCTDNVFGTIYGFFDKFKGESEE